MATDQLILVLYYVVTCPSYWHVFLLHSGVLFLPFFFTSPELYSIFEAIYVQTMQLFDLVGIL